jgi:hypothetical protein
LEKMIEIEKGWDGMRRDFQKQKTKKNICDFG